MRRLLLLLLVLPALAQNVLTLEDAIALALRENPGLRAARHDVEASRLEEDRAASVTLPHLYLEAVAKTGVPGVPNFRLPGLVNVGFADSAGGDLALTQMFDFGRTAARVDASRAQAEARRQEARTVAASLVLGIRRTYAEAVFGNQMLALAEEQIAARRRVVEWAEARFQRGLASRVDPRLAQADLAQAQADRANLKGEVERARATLRQAVGGGVPREFSLESLSWELDCPRRPVAPARPPRPELARALAQQETARADLEAAEAGSDPTLLLYATGGYLSALRPGLAPGTYAAGLSLSWPLFTGGQVEAEVEQARQRAEAAAVRTQEVTLQVEGEIERALATLEALLAAEPARADELSHAQDAQRLAALRYQHGLGSILEVQQTQLALTRAQGHDLQHRYRSWLAWQELRYATGELGEKL